MRIRVLVASAAVVSTVFAGSLNPGSAGAAPAAPEPVSSCASPPDTANATVENRDRFVELWSQRFSDSGWLKNYAERDTVPADILAEGFHAMGEVTQVWLNTCLLEGMLAKSGEAPTAEKFNLYLSGLQMIVFGKDDIAELREELTAPTPAEQTPQQPVQQDLTSGALESMETELATEPSLTSADHPKADVATPNASTTKNLDAEASPRLKQLLGEPSIVPETAKPKAPAAANATPTGLAPGDPLSLGVVPALLEAVDELLQLVSKIQGHLFTLPVLNPLASAFYRICGESPTMPLSCSVMVPVGVPVPVDLTGDNFPDVTGKLSPVTNLKDIGARFTVQRILAGANPDPLPAHIFAVYDTPFVKKRIEFGFDGRASTLAKHHSAQFVVKNVLQTVTTGDVDVAASVSSNFPGSTESLTFAVKDLVGGSGGVPAAEENPLTGAVQMSPFPEAFDAGAHLTHTNARSQDTFTVQSSTPTRVDALIDQATTTTTPESNRRFTATVDKLPTSVKVDLVREGEHQSIDYQGSAPIDLVQASDTTTLDVTHPGSYTKSVYEVKGVPTDVHVDLEGAQDILYSASAKVPEVSFSTETREDDELQHQITAKAHQIPASVHVTNLTTNDQQAITYDADSELQDVELTMYDLNEDKTNLVAKATGIPTHVEFTQNRSAGVYDFSAPGGIDLIEASLTRADGLLLPRPGDHATVLKQGDGLGLDLRLSGFESAHFDGSEDTTVSVGLNPGGQSFEAIADLDDPNVYARAFVSQLPTDMAVTLSPSAGSATYTASSIIPLLEASFTLRDTDTFATAKLTDLPKNIDLTFNTSGGTPQVTYAADSRLGSIEATYQEAPGALGVHAKISDLPQYMKITGKDPISFDARTSPAAPSGSSDIGQILFQYATDGLFQSAPTTDDHVYLNTVGGTHAELLYSGLAFASVNTTNQELHAELRNSAPRLVRAYLTTPNLTLTGFIDKVPASIKLDQVGNQVSYDASSSIAEIYTELNRTNGDQLVVDIQGVPSSVDVLFDGANSKLGWSASAATGSIAALAKLTPATIGGSRTFNAALTITSIPATWDASWANGNVLFQAGGSGIGSIAAKVTNHGLYHELPGDHLSAFFDQPSGDLDASLRISNLTKAQFTKLTNANGGGFEAALNMGNNGSFAFDGNVTLTSSKLRATGSFSNLPSAITLRSDGGRITYSGNTNPTLTMSVEAGTAAALAATPAPPSVHGVSVRDGQAGGNKAIKAKLFLTGLPTSLDLNSPAGTYSVGGYNPSIATLVLDVVLSALAPKPLTLQVQQVVPTASPVNFTFGPFLSSTAGDGTHSLSLNYTANQELGKLTAEATYDNTDDAKLEISSIPKTITVNAGFGAAQKSVNITMDSGINEITASYKKVGALNFAASVKLTDVPKWVNLLLGKASAVDGSAEVSTPDFTFTAFAPGLDIEAFAAAEIATPVDIHAAASLMVKNLGHTVTGALAGTTLNVTSTPATEKFLLTASGLVKLNVDLGFELLGGFIRNTGSLDINIDVKQLTLGFENASTLQLDLGVTTGLKGNYSSFTFGEDTKTVVTIQDKLRLVADLPDPIPNLDFAIIDIPPTAINFENVISSFRMASNRLDVVFSLRVIDILCCSVDAQLLARPHAEFSTAGSSFTVGQPPSDGVNPPAWLITPNLNLLGVSLPTFVVDVVAYFTSPYGRELQGRLLCDVPFVDPFDCTP